MNKSHFVHLSTGEVGSVNGLILYGFKVGVSSHCKDVPADLCLEIGVGR